MKSIYLLWIIENNIKIYNIAPVYINTKTLTGHIDSVYFLAIIPSNENIVSGSYQEIKVWN